MDTDAVRNACAVLARVGAFVDDGSGGASARDDVTDALACLREAVVVGSGANGAAGPLPAPKDVAVVLGALLQTLRSETSSVRRLAQETLAIAIKAHAPRLLTTIHIELIKVLRLPLAPAGEQAEPIARSQKEALALLAATAHLVRPSKVPFVLSALVPALLSLLAGPPPIPTSAKSSSRSGRASVHRTTNRSADAREKKD